MWEHLRLTDYGFQRLSVACYRILLVVEGDSVRADYLHATSMKNHEQSRDLSCDKSPIVSIPFHLVSILSMVSINFQFHVF